MLFHRNLKPSPSPIPFLSEIKARRTQPHVIFPHSDQYPSLNFPKIPFCFTFNLRSILLSRFTQSKLFSSQSGLDSVLICVNLCFLQCGLHKGFKEEEGKTKGVGYGGSSGESEEGNS